MNEIQARSTFASAKAHTLWSDAWQRLRQNRLALAGAAAVAILIIVALGAPVLSPYDPTSSDYSAISAPPSAPHPLGTDQLGRDLLSRILWGARVSVSVGIFTQVIVLLIGIPIGAIAGLAGGRTDNLLMRLTDVVYAFPDLLLVILFRAIFGPNIYLMFLAIGLASWVGAARLVRAQILSLKEREFVTAAYALGASPARIAVRHLLPNTTGPLVVYLTFNIPRAIFAEATLSYIGIGIAPPTPSWGSLVQEGAQAIFAAPTQALFPALAIAVTMMAFTFLGDGLRDALDPRSEPLSPPASDRELAAKNAA